MSGEVSPAVDGAGIGQCRSFKIAFNGSAGAASVGVLIAPGGYELLADQDCIVAIGGSGVLAAALPTAQPALGSPNGTRVVPAGVPTALDIPAGGIYISALSSTTTAGTLKISGPLSHTTVRG